MTPSTIAQANVIVNTSEEGAFSVINQKGFPETATRSNIKSDGIYSIYFSTGTEGPMADSIRLNSKSSVCFRKGNENVTLIGTTRIINDIDVKKSLWLDWFINHFPGGPEDPGYCVFHFETKEVSLWIDLKQEKFEIEDILKVQSYCGLFCDFCDFRTPHNCGTCISTGGKPFYGSCPIAECCREKGLAHCGHCPLMPCDKLNAYSCGEGEHCDNPKGSRLEILKKWVAEK